MKLQVFLRPPTQDLAMRMDEARMVVRIHHRMVIRERKAIRPGPPLARCDLNAMAQIRIDPFAGIEFPARKRDRLFSGASFDADFQVMVEWRRRNRMPRMLMHHDFEIVRNIRQDAGYRIHH